MTLYYIKKHFQTFRKSYEIYWARILKLCNFLSAYFFLQFTRIKFMLQANSNDDFSNAKLQPEHRVDAFN